MSRAGSVLHLIVGPNGAGKTTYYEEVLGPVTSLPFINADALALAHWPEDPVARAYDAGRLAAAERGRRIARRSSFVAETVFSHPSKLDLCRAALDAGYLLLLHVLLIPEELAVARVEERVRDGGHDVPVEKIRQRFGRLWRLVRQAIDLCDETEVLDNSRAATPFRRVARFEKGTLLAADWPPWTPPDLRARTS
jgi:predicted ABC-type ATPase